MQVKKEKKPKSRGIAFNKRPRAPVPLCFTPEEWDGWNKAARVNPFAWPTKPLMHCEDCTVAYRQEMVLQERCERKDDHNVIRWLAKGQRSQATK